MKKIIFYVLTIVNKVVGKKNTIVFHSFPDFADNSYALFNYIAGKYKNYRLIWLINNKNNLSAINANLERKSYKNIDIYPVKSISGILSYLSSKYIFHTHGIYSGIKTSRSQVNINLWHGMPLKKIGIPDGKKKKDLPFFDYTIAASEMFSDIMAEAFGIGIEKVLITGQPRNDLFADTENDVYGLKKYNKVFIWMPTYRKSVVGDIREEGRQSATGLPLICRDNLAALDLFLKNKNALLIIKIHGMDFLNNKGFINLNNIKFISNDDLLKDNIQLYQLVGQTDALITDYSSIYFDYLIMEKPIAYIIDDIEEYKNDRGFFISDEKLFDYMPGMKISNLSDFNMFFEKVCSDSFDIVYDKDILTEMNKYTDSFSSKRICDAVFNEVKK